MNEAKEIKFLRHVKEGNLSMVKKMVENEDFNIFCHWKGYHTRNAMYLAIEHKRLNIANYLISIGFKTDNISNGLIGHLAHQQRYDIIDFLVKNGVDKNRINTVVSVTLHGNNAYEKLAKYSIYASIDPCDILKNYWEMQLKVVRFESNYSKLIDKIDSLTKLRREINLMILTEIS